MRKIAESEYHQYRDLACRNTANTVYPLSIAEGIQAGEICIGDGLAVLFWHYCGFGYIAGNPSDAFLQEVHHRMISPDRFERLVLITDDPGVIRYFQERNITPRERIEYRFPRSACPHAAEENDRTEIVEIDEHILSEIHGRIIPSFSWDSPRRFLDNGFGYAACMDGRICAAAFSAAVSSLEIDIGVETSQEYRGQGLASALTMRMCRKILSLGKRPVYAHALSNTASMKTALRCGFEKDRVTYAIAV